MLQNLSHEFCYIETMNVIVFKHILEVGKLKYKLISTTCFLGMSSQTVSNLGNQPTPTLCSLQVPCTTTGKSNPVLLAVENTTILYELAVCVSSIVVYNKSY